MRADHDEVRRRIAALKDIRPPSQRDAGIEWDLRAALYGLDAIIRFHLAKEEELYYPLFDAHLDWDAVVEVTAALHQVEHDLYRADLPAEGRER